MVCRGAAAPYETTLCVTSQAHHAFSSAFPRHHERAEIPRVSCLFHAQSGRVSASTTICHFSFLEYPAASRYYITANTMPEISRFLFIFERTGKRRLQRYSFAVLSFFPGRIELMINFKGKGTDLEGNKYYFRLISVNTWTNALYIVLCRVAVRNHSWLSI